MGGEIEFIFLSCCTLFYFYLFILIPLSLLFLFLHSYSFVSHSVWKEKGRECLCLCLGMSCMSCGLEKNFSLFSVLSFVSLSVSAFVSRIDRFFVSPSFSLVWWIFVLCLAFFLFSAEVSSMDRVIVRYVLFVSSQFSSKGRRPKRTIKPVLVCGVEKNKFQECFASFFFSIDVLLI